MSLLRPKGGVLTNRVAPPRIPRGWRAAGTISVVVWVCTVAINLTAYLDTGDLMPAQLNALAVAGAASAGVIAVVLYAMRRLREGQTEVCVRVARLTDAYRCETEAHQLLIAAVKQNSDILTGQVRQTGEICGSYASLVQQVGMGLPVAALPGPRGGREN